MRLVYDSLCVCVVVFHSALVLPVKIIPVLLHIIHKLSLHGWCHSTALEDSVQICHLALKLTHKKLQVWQYLIRSQC